MKDEQDLSMNNKSSEAHPGSLLRGVLKTKINGCKSLRKIVAKSSNFNVTGFLNVPLITAYKKNYFWKFFQKYFFTFEGES